MDIGGQYCSSGLWRANPLLAVDRGWDKQPETGSGSFVERGITLILDSIVECLEDAADSPYRHVEVCPAGGISGRLEDRYLNCGEASSTSSYFEIKVWRYGDFFEILESW